MSNTMNESSACLALHQASRVVKPPRDIQQTMVDESETSTTQHGDESEDSATNMSAASPALIAERTPAATVDRPKPVKKTKKKKKKKAKVTTPMDVPKDLSSLAAEVQADSTTKEEEELDVAVAATASGSPLLEKTKKEKKKSKPIAYSSSADSAHSLPMLEPLEPPTKSAVSTKKKKKSRSSRDLGKNNSLLEPSCSSEKKDVIKIKKPKASSSHQKHGRPPNDTRKAIQTLREKQQAVAYREASAVVVTGPLEPARLASSPNERKQDKTSTSKQPSTAASGNNNDNSKSPVGRNRYSSTRRSPVSRQQLGDHVDLSLATITSTQQQTGRATLSATGSSGNSGSMASAWTASTRKSDGKNPVGRSEYSMNILSPPPRRHEVSFNAKGEKC